MISTKKLCYKIIDKISSLATTVGTLSTDMTTAQNNIANMWSTIYPVGSYYETSDTAFDPNASFGGTWVAVEPLTHNSSVAAEQVNVLSYDTSGNTYTAPKDGLIRITCGAAQANSIVGRILNPDDTAVWYAALGSPSAQSAATNNSVTIPIFKGQKFYLTKSGSSTSTAAIYYPFGSANKRWHRTA